MPLGMPTKGRLAPAYATKPILTVALLDFLLQDIPLLVNFLSHTAIREVADNLLAGINRLFPLFSGNGQRELDAEVMQLVSEYVPRGFLQGQTLVWGEVEVQLP